MDKDIEKDIDVAVIGDGFYTVEHNHSVKTSCACCQLAKRVRKDFCDSCGFRYQKMFLKRYRPESEEEGKALRELAEKAHSENPGAGFMVIRREGAKPEESENEKPDNMEKSKTFIETMDGRTFVQGDKFYEPFYCGPEIDPCKCCEIGDCPYTDCPFARYGRCLKEVKHVTDDMKAAAERRRSLNPVADILVLTPEDIQGDGLPTLQKAFDKFWQAVKDAEKSPKPTFRDIAGRIADLQERKNESYGNAFGQSCDKYGVVSALTRLNDKLNRLDSLYKSSEQSVFGESFSDTLTDLAAYAIMTIEWLENQKNDNPNP